MPKFSIRNSYFVVVCCLIICVLGTVSLWRMPVDLFPRIRIPVVVVATFYSGMPAEEIETSITGRFERFFTLGSGIEHIESKSLPGTSLIKIYFQPGTDSNAAVTTISNLAMANLRRLPPGTLPPVVLKFDASNLPLCLITLKAEGLNETQLRDIGQFAVRNQIAEVPGASAPQPFGGKYRQIMVYVDPLKLEAHQLSVMDVVRSVNDSNLILPAGDVRAGPYDYALFSNAQLDTVKEIDGIPIKTVGHAAVTVGDIGHAEDGSQIQTSIVRVDGQSSVYLPVLKQGGDANTIAIVDGVKKVVSHLLDVPKQLVAKVVFDQSEFVKKATANIMYEGAIGLGLTALMILLFLGNPRATLGVLISIPLSVLATFCILSVSHVSVNFMLLGGLALAFSRLIYNSVVVLENIYRHLERGETPEIAAERGGTEVVTPVLAATITSAIVFLPVVFLYGVSRYLFSALAVSVVLAVFASYVIAMTVVPLFCGKYIRRPTATSDVLSDRSADHLDQAGFGQRFSTWFNARFEETLGLYDRAIARVLQRPKAALATLAILTAASAFLLPLLGYSYFPRTDPGQFVINLKAPTGTRIEETAASVANVEKIIRRVIPEHDLGSIVSNIGITPGFSSMYTTNTGSHTAFVQVALKEGRAVGSYEHMDHVRAALRAELLQLTSYFQSGSVVDAVVNLGLPAPIDIQVSGNDLQETFGIAKALFIKAQALHSVSDIYIPEDIDAPGLLLNVNRVHASEMGLSQKEIVSNVITALTSNQMIAPSYWVDPKTGNDYMLTVQYPENKTQSLADVAAIPVRGPASERPTRLDTVVDIQPIRVPTMVNHYALRRTIDVYITPKREDLSQTESEIKAIIAGMTLPENVTVRIFGSVNAMHQSFRSFAGGFVLAVVLVYLVLVAQFKSFVEPLIILLAVPPGIAGALLLLAASGTTMNIMSVMGMVMLVGISVSNSILIVEFTHRLIADGVPLRDAVAMGCRERLRPVLMTSLATIIGLIPMALALGAGSEAYAPLARVIIGGVALSVAATIFCVPAAYLLAYRRRAGVSG
jgi:multidrug efflux pump subunit AcrB